jgi:hypothetical protein
MKETVTCKCGAVYERTTEKVIFRDQDSFNCYVCGEELDSWSSSRIPRYRLVHDPRKPSTEPKSDA